MQPYISRPFPLPLVGRLLNLGLAVMLSGCAAPEPSQEFSLPLEPPPRAGSPSVLTGSYEDGFAAYQQGEFGTALLCWRPLAQEGHVLAQHNLGSMYYEGQGVPQDYAEAAKWWRLAAEHGFAVDQFNLGLMYDMGQGVPQDDTEAADWYRKAAEQGRAEAQARMGQMYFRGQVSRRISARR
jgi:TPR repeat protein